MMVFENEDSTTHHVDKPVIPLQLLSLNCKFHMLKL